jgi:hypothetical protein
LMSSDYRAAVALAAKRPRACQLLAILLWMHNGLGYIYTQ